MTSPLPTPLAIETAGLRCWPGIEEQWDGHWVRRTTGGFTQRANSVQSLDPADDGNIDKRIADSCDWFSARGQQPIFRMTPLASPLIAQALDAQGWLTIDASQVFAMALEPTEPDAYGKVYDPLDSAYLAVQQRLQNYSAEKCARFEAVLKAIAVPVRGIVQYSAQGEAVGAALMDIADGIVVTGNVVTHSAHRRQGHGAAMMRTGLAWAHKAGARFAALNVSADNAAGQALYRSLGYRYRYDYTYRMPGSP